MLTSNSKKSSNNKQDIFKINLTKVINTRYLLSSRNFDIASIEIATNKESILYYRDFVTSLNSSGNGLLLAYAYLPYDSIAIPDDCFILGYPKAIGIENFPQIDFNKPLLRKGIIAGKNEKNRTIILDCPVYYGNSGGPAFEYYIDENGIIPRFYLIGVVTEFVPYVEKWCNLNSGLINSQMSNSGYSVVEPIDKILELIDKQK